MAIGAWPSACPICWAGTRVSILGVKELASGRAAILGFTMPIWTVLIGVLFLGEKLTRRVALAAVAVAIAIALLTCERIHGA